MDFHGFPWLFFMGFSTCFHFFSCFFIVSTMISINFHAILMDLRLFFRADAEETPRFRPRGA